MVDKKIKYYCVFLVGISSILFFILYLYKFNCEDIKRKALTETNTEISVDVKNDELGGKEEKIKSENITDAISTTVDELQLQQDDKVYYTVSTVTENYPITTNVTENFTITTTVTENYPITTTVTRITEHVHTFAVTSSCAYYPEEGHYESICVSEGYNEVVYESYNKYCYYCGAVMDQWSFEEILNHSSLHGAYGTYDVEVDVVWHEPVYESVWIVDREEYYEEEVVYECIECGYIK